jgi:hypothetical protein
LQNREERQKELLMATWLTSRHPRLLAPLALAAGLALALTFLGQASAVRGAAGTQQRLIGAAVSNGFRVQVTAIRVPEAGAAPDTATVRIAAFKRIGTSWDRLGQVLTVVSARAGSGTWSPVPTGCAR